MASATALDLVNQVRRMARFNDVLVTTDAQSKVILDAVNGAISSVLGERTWSFDRRTTGSLRTVAAFSGTNGSFSTGTSTFNAVLYAGPLVGDYLLRANVGSDPAVGNAAPIVSSYTYTLIPNAQIFGTLETPWAGSNYAANASFKVFAFEYLLPDSVRRVESVYDDAGQLRLLDAGDGLEWGTLFARPWDSFGVPQVASVGGYESGVYVTGAAIPEPKLTLRLWPVPDSARNLRYSYFVRHPDLTSATSMLVGVPSEILSPIVDTAYALYLLSGAGNDPVGGTALLQRTSQSLETLYRRDAPGSAVRHTLQPWSIFSHPRLGRPENKNVGSP